MKRGPKPKGGTTYAHTPAELDAIRLHVVTSGDSGMSRADMLAVMPMQKARMKWLLSLLTSQRRIAAVGWTRWTRYYSAEAAKRAEKAQRRMAAEKAIADEAADTSGEILPFRRLIVPAHQAAPLMPAGPRSVFELARVGA